MERSSAEEKSIALHAKCRFKLVLGYEFWSLLKTALLLWNTEQQYKWFSFTSICV
jgi:hypothetical protein